MVILILICDGGTSLPQEVVYPFRLMEGERERERVVESNSIYGKLHQLQGKGGPGINKHDE